MFLLILLLPSWSPRSSWTEIRRRGIKINNNDGSQGWWDRDQSLTSIPPWFTERRQGSVVFHWALHLQQCVKSMKYNPTIKKRKHINTTPEKTVFMCNFKFYFKIVTELTLAKTIFLGLTYCLEGGDFWQPPPPILCVAFPSISSILHWVLLLTPRTCWYLAKVRKAVCTD